MKYRKLSDIIERYHKKCGSNTAIISGVDINKQFIPTRANLEGTDVSGYYIVPPKHFACNLMHIGRDERIPIAFNSSDDNYVVTSAYYVFRLKEAIRNQIMDEFLYIVFNTEEFDRLTWFNTDSSVRGNLKEERFLDIEIPLPTIEEQQKAVNAWKALCEIKEQNEAIAAPLMQMCQSYIQELKHEYEAVEIGEYIEICDEKNTENEELPVMGINIEKEFMPTAANTTNINLSSYKIMKKGRFVFSGMQTGRDMCIRTGLYSNDENSLVSPAYTTYTVNEEKGLLSQYLDILFRRRETDRLGAFYSDASVRANLEWYRFLQIKVPIPPIEKQQAIVNIYNCANEAKKIAAEADRMSREVCPALIQHVIHN